MGIILDIETVGFELENLSFVSARISLALCRKGR